MIQPKILTIQKLTEAIKKVKLQQIVRKAHAMQSQCDHNCQKHGNFSPFKHNTNTIKFIARPVHRNVDSEAHASCCHIWLKHWELAHIHYWLANLAVVLWVFGKPHSLANKGICIFTSRKPLIALLRQCMQLFSLWAFPQDYLSHHPWFWADVSANPLHFEA